ncbi:hypothetical protein [uncultured Cellulomonas sp.]|uniref:hypothetical protein n=1 Tax=uncultured Cellulomonas sp. TaxID=189682 RepID=UPI0028E97B41|nr:hypothetical protein [uncultured Cellulomonas sp.]
MPRPGHVAAPDPAGAQRPVVRPAERRLPEPPGGGRPVPVDAGALRSWQRLAGNRVVARLVRAPATSAGGVVVQRDGNDRVPIAIHFSTPQTRDQFIATTNAQLGLTGTRWRNVKEQYAASDSPVRVLVLPSTLRAARSKATAEPLGLAVEGDGAISGTSDRAEAFARMPAGGEKQALLDEIDRRYYQATDTPAGTKITQEQTGRRELWLQIQSEVLAQRAFVQNLPAKVGLVIRTRAGGVVITPAMYGRLAKVAAKIQALSDADVENYLSQGGGTAASLDALETAVDEFVAAKTAAPGEIADVMKAAAAGTWDVDSLVAAMPARAMFYLSLADRMTLVRQLADGFSVGDEDEQSILRLLTSTPSSDVKALGAELKANESGLLKKLESVLDGAENKQFYAVLRSIVFAAMDPEAALRQMQAAKIFPWADPGIIKATYNKRFYYETVEYTDEGKIRVAYWINAGPFGMKTADQVLEPDEIIGVHFFMDEDFANAVEGETMYMPAASLISFKNEQFSRELHLAVDVGLLFAGGAGLLTKASRLAKVIAVLDTTVAAAAIVINSFRSDIAKSPEGKQFLQAWDVTQTLIAAYGIGKLVLRLPDTFRSLRRSYDAFKGAKTDLPKESLTKIDDEAAKLFTDADAAVFESELAALRAKFTPEELAAFEAQLAKAGTITDAAKRQAAISAVESQVASQKHNVELVAELRAANPTLKEGELARLAAARIEVPTVPHGMTPDEFAEAQQLIKDWLASKGRTGTTGFATGSRVTGATFNPGKKDKFGQLITDFKERDLDITLVHEKPLTNSQRDELQRLYKARFKHDLGIRAIDASQLAHIPVWGKIDLAL